MKKEKLHKILKLHLKWLKNKKGGKRANLWNADLQDADLQYANLQYANLQYANLQYANLWNANLQYANLQYADLWNANLQYANLQDADLRDADLQYANLRNANLWNADIQDADLQDANLRNANLRNANLRDADLRDADLRDAKGLSMHYRSNLNILKYQKGKLRAFKYLNGNSGPYQNSIYEVSKTYEVDDVDRDIYNLCGRGINVASIEWCLRDANFDLDKTYIEVEFDVKDIVCIPFASDGKFRVKKIRVVRKLSKKEIEKEFKQKG
jgi:hypothetical protein